MIIEYISSFACYIYETLQLLMCVKKHAEVLHCLQRSFNSSVNSDGFTWSWIVSMSYSLVIHTQTTNRSCFHKYAYTSFILLMKRTLFSNIYQHASSIIRCLLSRKFLRKKKSATFIGGRNKRIFEEYFTFNNSYSSKVAIHLSATYNKHKIPQRFFFGGCDFFSMHFPTPTKLVIFLRVHFSLLLCKFFFIHVLSFVSLIRIFICLSADLSDGIKKRTAELCSFMRTTHARW